MTNFEFHKLEIKLQHLLRVTEKYQKEYREATGQKYLLGQGIVRLKMCCDCHWVTNNGQQICCCEESPFFDQVVSEGCSEWYEIDGGSIY